MKLSKWNVTRKTSLRKLSITKITMRFTLFTGKDRASGSQSNASSMTRMETKRHTTSKKFTTKI